MEKGIKLSVLVTFCRQKEFIEDALNSIFNQKTNFKYEVLVGLDGNDSESEEIINKYPVKLIKCDNSKTNTISIEKASINRLNLLLNAAGEYFCFLDGDDFYTDSSRFQTLVDMLDKNKEIIGCAHSRTIYDNNTKKSTHVKYLCNEETIITAKTYLKKMFYIFSNEFIFRNIFCGLLPADFPRNFLNDSTLTAYMLKYGAIYYIPKPMMGYRINTESIFSSIDISSKFFYALLAGEINFRVLSAYSKYAYRKYHKILKKCILGNIPAEYKVISAFAEKNNCLFTYNILNFNTLSLKEKLIFSLQILGFLLFNKYPSAQKGVYLSYFSNRSNFGDSLNLYIIQRLMGVNVQEACQTRKAELSAIGSILDRFICKPYDLHKKFRRIPLKIWGSGFIEAPKIRKEIFSKKVHIYALRGKISKERCEKILGKELNNIILGDPGLLASKLIDARYIKKKYQVGIIPHFVDMNSEYLKNIKVKNYKIINIMDNPIKILNEIAECEIILSSAMHGLITADSLGIPNQWIVLSDKLCGGSYKFKDYYSVYGFEPQPIDLRISKITEFDLEKIRKEYPNKIQIDKVTQIQKELCLSFPLKKASLSLSLQAKEPIEDFARL